MEGILVAERSVSVEFLFGVLCRFRKKFFFIFLSSFESMELSAYGE